jgi:gamma-glutamylcyclotransferase (GGCT)/AIG2-like uncharacterized protein YtfP
MVIRHLFVYGTLMPGHYCWHSLAPWAACEPLADSATGDLFDTGYGWPAAVIGCGKAFPGFTVRLERRSLFVALDVLDDIEGTNHGLFRRISTITEKGIRTWVYDWTRATDSFTPIDSWNTPHRH